MLRIGLNPYGLSYTILGWPGENTLRANPNPYGLPGYLKLAEELGAHVIEFPDYMLEALDDASIEALRETLLARGVTPVLSQSPPVSAIDRSLRLAKRMGAKVVRLALTPVLCGARGELGAKWPELYAETTQLLRSAAPRAAEKGLTLAVENHQDFTSAELLELCEHAGPNVGITLDTGNPLAVGEDPVTFARAVAPRVRHVHLKDYRAHWDNDGYRLVRCATGDGAVNFPEVARALLKHHTELPAMLEPGALSARYVKLFTPGWWENYAPRAAKDLAGALAAARVRALPDHAEWRTPWEQEAPAGVIIAYELEQIHRSAANVRAWPFAKA